MTTKYILPILLWVVAAITSTSTIAAGRDGAWWLQLSATEKVFYVVGLTDGVTVGLSTITLNCYAEDDSWKEDTAKCISEYGTAFSHGFNRIGYNRQDPANIVAGIDALYSDYKNINIPVSNAMTQVLRGMNGESNLEETLEKLRKFN